MFHDHKKSGLSRREFLRMAGVLASATVLGACAPQTPAGEMVEVEVMPTEETHTEGMPTATPPPPPTEIVPTATPVVAVEPAGFEMVLVEPGGFPMGSDDGRSSEQPVHPVNITKPFYIARHAVTIDQYDQFCEDTGAINPDEGLGEQPVGIIWYDTTAFCNWLSEQAGLDPCYEIRGVATRCDFAANGYRLPTEAEWEYAARGGPRGQGYTYSGSDDPDEVAWYEENSGGQVHPVGQKEPNELGVYDMSGNLAEWCWDWYVKDYYATSPSDDPTGPDSVGRDFMDRLKVCRGGCFLSDRFQLRIAYRSYDGPDYRDGGSAIRLVRAE